MIAPSFSDIFYANCTKNGLLPIALGEDEVRSVAAAGDVTVDLASQTVRAGEQTFQFDVDPDIKERLLNGLDEIALTLQHEADITAYERARAYPGPSTAAL